MKVKQWSMIVSITFLLGYFLGRKTKKHQRIKPEEALINVKKSFKEKYEVSGSWIYMKTEYLQKNDLEYEVYHGGITRLINGKNIPYEFYLDTHTGTIVDMFPTKTFTP